MLREILHNEIIMPVTSIYEVWRDPKPGRGPCQGLVTGLNGSWQMYQVAECLASLNIPHAPKWRNVWRSQTLRHLTAQTHITIFRWQTRSGSLQVQHSNPIFPHVNLYLNKVHSPKPQKNFACGRLFYFEAFLV